MVRFRQCLLNSLLVSGNRLMTQGTGTGIACGYRSTWHRRDPNNYSTSSGIPGTRERTLIAVKPDGVQRRLIGQVIQRFEQRGFRLVGLKMVQASDELISQHYAALNRKPFYPSLLRYMTSGPVVAMVWEGHNVVKSSRMLVGSTNPAEAAPGTLRGDFSIHINRNIVHASDSVEVAQREISLWFQRSELTTWESCDHTSICHT